MGRIPGAVHLLVSEADTNAAFEGTNFGNSVPRDVIRFGLLKVACGYANGRTAKLILLELKLIEPAMLSTSPKLTDLGRMYLFEAFKEGYTG